MLTKLLNNVFSVLSSKEIDILTRRFGLEGDIDTLEEIGNDYNLTRERVRQIQVNALNKIKKLVNEDKEINFILEKSKILLDPLGVKRENYFLKLVSSEFKFSHKEVKIFKFLTFLSEKIIYQHNFSFFDAYYAKDVEVHNLARHVLKKIYFNFFEKNKIYTEEEILNLVSNEIKFHFKKEVDSNEVINFIKILKIIGKNPFNFYGLLSNNYISPKCLKDKIYFIFMIEKRPLHYKEIYNKLHNLAKVEDELIHFNWHKFYNIKSIKNELIKHKDLFISEGKGIYYIKKFNFVING